MRSARSLIQVALTGCLALACNDGSGPGSGAVLTCTDASTEVLAIGEHRILDPTTDDACVRLPAAGPAGAEHLYVPVAAAGQETEDGVSTPYAITGSNPAIATLQPLRSRLESAFQPPQSANEFHRMLRGRERTLTEGQSGLLFSNGQKTTSNASPPALGEQRTFKVCSSRLCNTFVDATATAKAVGQRVAIFVDNDAPAGGYTDPQLVEVGNLFDDFLYPVDTVAFGRESDVDGNAVVIVLLTHRVNALTPDCNSSGSVVLGYFFGADLLPLSAANTGSNEAEIFYGLVPDPLNTSCDISPEFALSRLPATFIHEFQHMISFNQHVLVRGGISEDTWLNEGLSHFAEELGGRQIPAAECPVSGSCVHDFIQGDMENGLEYLASPEDHFLIEPGSSSAELAERGANWLFVRWLVDHFASDTLLGTDFTRRLVATRRTGVGNVETEAGIGFDVLVPEWQMTNYLDDLPEYQQVSSRLRYKTWNFRGASDSLGQAYPLVPDMTSGPGYSHSGVLRAGSGRHVLVTQAGGASAVDLQLTSPSGQEPVSSSASPRIGLVRIR